MTQLEGICNNKPECFSERLVLLLVLVLVLVFVLVLAHVLVLVFVLVHLDLNLGLSLYFDLGLRTKGLESDPSFRIFLVLRLKQWCIPRTSLLGASEGS